MQNKLFSIFGIALILLLAGGMYLFNKCEKPQLTDIISAREICLSWLMETRSTTELAKKYCDLKQRNPCYIDQGDITEVINFINQAYDDCVNKELEDNGFCAEEK